jgi:probable phosphoglycerate mutase
MTTLYLIRHAQGQGNLHHFAQGHLDSGVTELGTAQISALERRFEHVDIDKVYSSDLSRAVLTAQAVAKPKALPIQTRPDLREICVGVWEGRNWDEIRQEYPRQLDAFLRNSEDWRVPGSETMEQVRRRMMTALVEISEENDGKTVAVFSHGCALRLALGAMLGQRQEDGVGGNTSVSKAEYDHGSFRVLYRDDMSHLNESVEKGED